MDKRRCFCASYHCNGKGVPTNTYQTHNRKDQRHFSLHGQYNFVKPHTTSICDTENSKPCDIPLHDGTDVTVLSVLSEMISRFTDNHGTSKRVLNVDIETYH